MSGCTPTYSEAAAAGMWRSTATEAISWRGLTCRRADPAQYLLQRQRALHAQLRPQPHGRRQLSRKQRRRLQAHQQPPPHPQLSA